jgi:hypothetical protein
MPDTPYHTDLMATVDKLYARLPARVPATLEACICPVCMTAETLADIIATPVRELTWDHLNEYRNSAHGVPVNPDDLRAMVPRYLDLIAQDTWNDGLGVGADLLRFGDGRMTHAPLFDPETDRLLNLWARLVILHIGTAEAMNQETNYSLLGLIEVILVGGWPVAMVTQTLDELFSTACGPTAQGMFIECLAWTLPQKGRFDLWSLDRYRAEAIPAFATWLNNLLCAPAMQEWLLSPEIFAQPWSDPMVTISGNITRQTFATKD